MQSKKVAVVTGSNKGIGFEIVKGLCKKFDGDVYLTARNVKKGQEAVKKIKDLGYNPLFHQLDITDQASIDNFKNHIKENHGGLDLLVNNAAIAYLFEDYSAKSLEKQTEDTLNVNYFGTLKICEALFPLLRNNAKVVNISSSAGSLGRLPSTELRSKFKNPNLTIEGLTDLMKKFITSVKEGKNVEEGWGDQPYSISKIGVSALTIIQQRNFDKEQPNRNISVNAVHPGFVNTDINAHHGSLTPEEGARAPLWTALEANVKGKYIWKDCQVLDWFESEVTPTRH